MSYRMEPSLPKWPFYLGNIIFLGMAWAIYAQSGRTPMGRPDLLLVLLCAAVGAMFSIAPFVLEYRTAVRLLESSGLVKTVEQIRDLEGIAAQIAAATARWQAVQEYSTTSVNTAKEIADKITGEATAFTEFLQKANDTDRSNLRLEVDKLRRMENEWLQIIVRLLDHTFALHKAAERSGQPGLIEQLGRFQDSCRDVARRIGLVPVVPAASELFDPQWHHLADAEAHVAPGAKIRETIATGYTYQGRLIRQALVALQGAPAAEGDTEDDDSKEEVEEGTLI